jgi:CDGSH-type Zn-finger protein
LQVAAHNHDRALFKREEIMADANKPKFDPKVPKVAALEPAELELEKGVYFWCACGYSLKQPFCDGSHRHTEMSAKRFVVEETKKLRLCQCKRTRTPPYCDGMHEQVAAVLAAAAKKNSNES